jgi:hypothetical protein
LNCSKRLIDNVGKITANPILTLPTKSITEIKGKNRAIPPDLGKMGLAVILPTLFSFVLILLSKKSQTKANTKYYDITEIKGKNRAIPPDLGIAWLIACSIPSTSDMIVWDLIKKVRI